MSTTEQSAPVTETQGPNTAETSMVPAGAQAATDIFLPVAETGSNRVWRSPFRMEINCPSIARAGDFMGTLLRSDRLGFIFEELPRPIRGEMTRVTVKFVLCDDDTVKTPEEFAAHIQRLDKRGFLNGIDNRFYNLVSNNAFWDSENRQAMPIAVEEGKSAYRHAVIGHEPPKGFGRMYKQRLEVPLWMITKTLRDFSRVVDGDFTVQAINVIAEGNTKHATRLVILKNPSVKREEAEGKVTYSLRQPGIILLLDDARFCELNFAEEWFNQRMPLVERLFTGRASKDFKETLYSVLQMFHETGTPIGGKELVGLIASNPNLISLEDICKESDECDEILLNPSKYPTELVEQATINLVNLHALAKAMTEWLTARTAKIEAMRVQLEAAKAPKAKANSKPEASAAAVTATAETPAKAAAVGAVVATVEEAAEAREGAPPPRTTIQVSPPPAAEAHSAPPADA